MKQQVGQERPWFWRTRHHACEPLGWPASAVGAAQTRGAGAPTPAPLLGKALSTSCLRGLGADPPLPGHAGEAAANSPDPHIAFPLPSGGEMSSRDPASESLCPCRPLLLLRLSLPVCLGLSLCLSHVNPQPRSLIKLPNVTASSPSGCRVPSGLDLPPQGPALALHPSPSMPRGWVRSCGIAPAAGTPGDPSHRPAGQVSSVDATGGIYRSHDVRRKGHPRNEPHGLASERRKVMDSRCLLPVHHGLGC